MSSILLACLRISRLFFGNFPTVGCFSGSAAPAHSVSVPSLSIRPYDRQRNVKEMGRLWVRETLVGTSTMPVWPRRPTLSAETAVERRNSRARDAGHDWRRERAGGRRERPHRTTAPLQLRRCSGAAMRSWLQCDNGSNRQAIQGMRVWLALGCRGMGIAGEEVGA